MSLVEARDLVKRFGSLTAVDDISFSVERGEVVGFLGPNGAGKSTAMKIISGFMEPTSGQAWIDGHNSHPEPNPAPPPSRLPAGRRTRLCGHDGRDLPGIRRRHARNDQAAGQ